MNRTTPRLRAALRLQASTAVVVALGAASLGVGAGAAYAAWLVSGSDASTATAALAKDLVVTVSAPTGLYPGARKPVSVTIANPNEFPVDITSISVTATGSDKSTCGASGNITVAPYTDTMPAIAAGESATVTITNGVTLAVGADNACQGVTFTLAGSVAGKSPG